MSSVVVCLGLGGCGGCNDNNGVGHLPDAPPAPDAPLDTPIDMAPLSPVTLTVTEGGDPLMGVTVYFQESDSTLVKAAQTGADGKASAVVHAGGFVTAVQVTLPQPTRQGSANEGLPQGPDSQLHTFAGVKPGDDLHLDLHPVTPETTDVTFDLSVPNEELGHTYTLYSSCGKQKLQPSDPGLVRRRSAGLGSGSATPVTATVTLTGCGGTADMLVVGGDDETLVHSWLYKPAVAVADEVAVDLTDAYQNPTDVTFTYTGVPPIIDELTVQRELRSGRGSLEFFMGKRAATPDMDTGIASVTRPLPVAAGLLAVTTTTDFPNTGNGQQTFVEWGATGDYTLKYDEVALHGYASMPSADVSSHAIAWSEASGGVAPDFVFGSFDLERSGEEGLNTWSWQIVAPYTAGQAKLTYPVLPTTLYDYNPGAEEQPQVRQLTTVKAPGGYDAHRARAFNEDPALVITGATGRNVVEKMFDTSPRRGLSGRFAPRKR